MRIYYRTSPRTGISFGAWEGFWLLGIGWWVWLFFYSIYFVVILPIKIIFYILVYVSLRIYTHHKESYLDKPRTDGLTDEQRVRRDLYGRVPTDSVPR